MKKRITTFVLAVIFILSLGACGKSNSDGGNGIFPQTQSPSTQTTDIEPTPGQKSTPQETVTEVKKSKDNVLEQTPADITLNMPENGELHIKSYAITKDLYKEDIIVVWADYTNLDDDDHASSYLLRRLDLYQDDIKLVYSGEYQSETGTVVRTNKTIEVAFSYKLRDITTDVYFELATSKEVFGSAVLPIN